MTASPTWCTARLPYRPPLDWAGVIAFLRPRATRGVELVEVDRYRRTVAIAGAPAVLELRVAPGEAWLSMSLNSAHHAPAGTSTAPEPEVTDRAARIFDLGADPETIAAALSRSAELADLVRRRPGVRVPGAWDGFELAVRAILGQQISVAAASTLASRLAVAFGQPFDGGPGLTHLFPAPATLAEAGITRIGATRAQTGSIRALAAAVATGELVIEANAGLEEFVARLCALRGIGPWTAHYVAMRACGEPDAFPASDLGLRRAAGNGTLLSARELSDRAEAWRPWRAYAAMYLWGRDSGTEAAAG
jgi:AraC family transcriptional regulator of adaptative response / DNA-3-methyladenine glycosylase II